MRSYLFGVYDFVPDACQNELANAVLGWHELAPFGQFSGTIVIGALVTKCAQIPLSRRRHGFESRWGCSEKPQLRCLAEASGIARDAPTFGLFSSYFSGSFA